MAVNFYMVPEARQDNGQSRHDTLSHDYQGRKASISWQYCLYIHIEAVSLPNACVVHRPHLLETA